MGTCLVERTLMKFAYFIFILLTISSSAQAQERSWNHSASSMRTACLTALSIDENHDKVKNYKSEEILYGMDCMGFMRGYASALSAVQTLGDANYAQSKGSVCLPQGWTTGQIAMIFVRKCESAPELLNQSAAAVLHAALLGAFPCR